MVHLLCALVEVVYARVRPEPSCLFFIRMWANVLRVAGKAGAVRALATDKVTSSRVLPLPLRECGHAPRVPIYAQPSKGSSPLRRPANAAKDRFSIADPPLVVRRWEILREADPHRSWCFRLDGRRCRG
jgi:hypothetical protein